MKEIALTNKFKEVVDYALVDDEDFEWLSKRSWHRVEKHKNYYAVASTNVDNFSMHRLIMGLSKGDGIQVDHIDINGLNNQKYNLRLTNNQQNNQNRPSSGNRNHSSRFRGVSWSKRYEKWEAHATIDYKKYTLGHFDDEELAAQAAIEFRAKHMTHSLT